MYLIYRGVRYELPSSNFQQSLSTGSSAQSQGDRVAVSPLISPLTMLQYRGVSYIRRNADLPQQRPDPELESFMAAFWAIINA